jgi:tRNA(fMet)-specific endonuclease VapC
MRQKIFQKLRETPIGDHDMQIAAQARRLGLIVVTANIREFSRIGNLRIENWAKSTNSPN